MDKLNFHDVNDVSDVRHKINISYVVSVAYYADYAEIEMANGKRIVVSKSAGESITTILDAEEDMQNHPDGHR